MNPTKSSNWLLNYIVLGIIWGSSFFFIMLALETLPPIGIAFWRTAIGAATLAIILVIQKVALPKTLKQWSLLWVSGLLMSGICGQPSTTSSASADLQSSLVNKLQAKTASLGSTLWRLTWKARKIGRAHV